MSTEKSSENGPHEKPSGAEMARLIENGEWDKVKEMLTLPPEEVERILREETMIDAAIVNRLMEEMDANDDRQAILGNGNCG